MNFSIAHVGINCGAPGKAQECASLMQTLFGLPINPEKESTDASFTGTQLEWLKSSGRGTHGHIAIATDDLPAARVLLEEKGLTFDESSIKYFPDGRILVIYATTEIGGFSIHLMQT